MDKKRLLAIIGFILLTLLFGFAMYWVFFRTPPAPQAPPDTAGPAGPSAPGGQFPGAGTGQPGTGVVTPGDTTLPPAGERPRSAIDTSPRVAQVVAEDISGAAPADTGAKFYNRQDGRFYRVDANGELRVLSDQVFFNVSKVTWSPAKNESIIEYPDGSNIYYNFDTKRQVTLPKHWEDFTFAPQSDRIAAKSIGISPENRWLVAATPDGNNIELIEPMGDNADKVIVDWSPNNQIVALSRTGEPLGADRQEVLFVGLNGENFRSTIVEGRGLTTSWSPEGRQLLYSVYSARGDFKPELWIVNAQGESIGSGRKFLNLNTWADKCTFQDERFVYCGVPTSLETGVGFAPDLASQTPDQIMRIDLVSGGRVMLPTDQPHTVNDIFLGEDGKTLFFTDKNKEGLFQIQL